MTRWMREFALGARFAVAGGRAGWVRLVMTAVGVGLGVALLLAAAAIPAMLQARHDRTAGRDLPTEQVARGDDTLLVQLADTSFRDHRVYGRILRPEGPAAPVPPGLTRLPGPNELVVSPALARLLASDDGALLRPRLDHPIVGTIGDAGLAGPSEYAFYLGSDRLEAGKDDAWRIDHVGLTPVAEPLHPLLLLLIAIALVVLLLPVTVFIAAAVRFGGDGRDRRLAALRLVGADRRAVRRMAAGESIVAAAVGIAVGVLLLLALRPLVERFTVLQISVFAEDIQPTPVLTLLVLVAVPACAVGATLLALRRTVIEPLGVFRQAIGSRRRLWWRLILPAVGLLALTPILARDNETEGFSSDAHTYQVAAGTLLLLVGVAALLPWLIEAAVRRLGGGGGLGWQLAVRRLQLTSGTAARLVNGVAVAVAGTIALQTLFASTDQMLLEHTGQDPSRAQVLVTLPQGADAAPLRTTQGVREMLSVSQLSLPGSRSRLEVGDCAALREIATVDRCADGDVFLVGNGTVPLPSPGQWILPDWRIPSSAPVVQPRRDPAGQLFMGVYATPKAIPQSALRDAHTAAYLRIDPAQPDVHEHIRNAAARIDPATQVLVLARTVETGQFTAVRQALSIGVLATLLLIGVSMLVTTLEQLRDRRRLLAVLVAFGTRRSTLIRSVIYQVAVPVVLGMTLAAATGALLSAVLLTIVDQPAAVDWGSVAAIAAAGAGLVLGVTMLSLPTLWRLTQASGLRSE